MQKSTHGYTCLCEKYSEPIGLEEIQKNPFLVSPRELSQSIINCFHAHTQVICVSVCMLSSFPHGLSNRQHVDSGDSTMIYVLSIFQSLCLSAFVVTINKRLSKDKLLFKTFLLPSVYLK